MSDFLNMKVENGSSLDRIEDTLQRLDQAAVAHGLQLALLMMQRIRSSLDALLGTKAKHYEVDFIPMGTEYTIFVSAVDDVGKYLYNGTISHVIRSNGSNPMPVGSNQFAHTVHHPGTPGMREQINDAILRGVLEARALAGGMRGSS